MIPVLERECVLTGNLFHVVQNPPFPLWGPNRSLRKQEGQAQWRNNNSSGESSVSSIRIPHSSIINQMPADVFFVLAASKIIFAQTD